MAAPISPAKKLANGNDTYWFVPTLADKAAPTATEINATGGLNITGYLISEYEDPTSETEKVTLPRVMLETDETEVNGATTHGLPDMLLTLSPQAAEGSDGKKAWELFEGGTVTGFVVRRQDKPGITGDATAGEFVDVWPVEAQRKAPGKTSTGPDGVYVFTVSYSVTGTPEYQVAVAA